MSVPNRLPSYPGGPPASGGQDPHAARPTAALPQGYPTNPGMPPTGHPTGHGYPQQAYGQQQAYPQQGYPTNPGAQLESGVVPTPQGYQALAAPHVTAPPPHAGAASASLRSPKRASDCARGRPTRASLRPRSTRCCAAPSRRMAMA